MAHQLTIREDGVVEMAYYGQVPWHRLGTDVGEELSPEKMRIAANLDWEIKKVQNYTPDMHIIPDSFHLVRSDVQGKANSENEAEGILACVGRIFDPFQPADFVEVFNEITRFVKDAQRDELGGVKMMHTMGSLLGGRKIWALAKLPTEVIIGKHDKVNQYLLLVTANDGTSKTKLRFCNERVVCANTLSKALHEDEVELAVKHSPGAKAKILDGVEKIGIMVRSYEETAEVWEAMNKHELNTKSLNDYIAQVVPAMKKKDEKTGEEVLVVSTKSENVRNKMVEIFEEDPLKQRTLWTAFNAANEYYDHHQNHKKGKRVDSVLFGTTAKKQRIAFAAALDVLAKAA